MVSVIPVRMVEAWMLADPQALAIALGTGVEPKKLGLPDQPQRVESIRDPKATLEAVIAKTCQGRSNQRHVSPGAYYAVLGETISLERLDRVPAYAAFRQELEGTLSRLHM